MLLLGLIFVAITALTKCSDADLTIEAAFQGRCGHGSPCEQLCYEIHDGMYECDCTEGYELNKNGYSCQEINSTLQFVSAFPSAISEIKILNKNSQSVESKNNFLKNENTDYENNNQFNKYKNEKPGDEIYDDDELDYDPITITTITSKVLQSTNTNLNHKTLNEISNNKRNIISFEKTLTKTANEPKNLYSVEHDVIKTQQKSVDDFYSKEDFSNYNNLVNNLKETAKHASSYHTTVIPTTTTLSDDNTGTYTLENSIDNAAQTNESEEQCILDCGFEGICVWNKNGTPTQECICPFGRAGPKCNEEIKVNTPRFTSKSWIAFPALKGAYKHVQLHIEIRPELYDGIILLTGERDDLTGDFMAVLIHKGYVEFWFDCGSGTGVVRSEETVILNQWNTILIYRHRWDSWLILNQGNRVQGRSKGLFSRITFREPVFLGGIGNITGINKKLPVRHGITGCIRKFVANEHEYNFQQAPYGDVSQGFNILECTTDHCSRFPCRHGGKCISADDGAAVCLCPLGFGGDLCEMRLDLQVPSFNGSSYLRYAPLGDNALVWLDIQVTLKPQQNDGLLLYSGHHEYGDFISLCLNMGFVEFTYDLGSGQATVRSDFPLTLNQWHTIHISRTARLAVLKIDLLPEVATVSLNGFWHLSLPHSLFLGGVHNIQTLPASIREKGSFVGCIQKFVVNERAISIISEALGGSNVDTCLSHACVAHPCGPLEQCVPNMESYECECKPNNVQQCNQAEEVPFKVLTEVKGAASTYSTTEMTTTQEIDTTLFVTKDRFEDDNALDLKIQDVKSPSNWEKKSDYYYYDDYNDDEDFSKDDGSGSSTNTETQTTIKLAITMKPSTTENNILRASVKSPYKELIKDIESHYTLKGKYMLLDSVIDKHNKRKQKSEKKNENKSRQKFKKKQKLLKDDQYANYIDRNTQDISSDFIFNTNEEKIKRQQEFKTENLYHPKQRYPQKDNSIIDGMLIDEMNKIMKNSGTDRSIEDSWKVAYQTRTTLLPKLNNILNQQHTHRPHSGACFNGHDSYFHYSDVETMRRVISYQIDLNLRFKTHSNNGLILWSGRHSAQEDDDFLSLGIEEGFLHLRYNLGSGEVNIEYNTTVVSDGLWHRIRAVRNLQEGTLKVDGGKPIVQRSPGKLRQLNTDAGLYVGGMPDPLYYTRNRYPNGILGCISEVVLAGELKLDFDVTTCLDCAHNVEPGIL